MITIVLHTHLPYVLHHGAWPHGSDWLSEAVAECYLPLIKMCDVLMSEGIRPGITFDVSPVLCEQLAHKDFAEVFRSYCDEHAALAARDKEQFEREGATELAALAGYWQDWFTSKWAEFEEIYNTDIIGALKRLQEENAVELITCGATHAYLPLIAEDANIDLQLRIAVESHSRHFGRHPRGIWLPECAYRPAYDWRTYLPVNAYAIAKHRDGIEQFMVRYSLEYFVTDEAALKGAQPLAYRGPDGRRTPYTNTIGDARAQLEERSPFDMFRIGGLNHDESSAVFVRNMDAAMQVWSGKTGYPGDPDYLDFHKRYFKSSHRYWRVTDNAADMQYKQPYVPEWANSRALSHARHYAMILANAVRLRTVQHPARIPTVCLPFDAELFGHWWFEGPSFIEHLIRELHTFHGIGTSTTSEQYDRVKPATEVALPESSWGKNSNHDVWMNDDVQWTWEREYRLERSVRMFCEKHAHVVCDTEFKRLAVNMFRQMMLAQASDWQFLISTFSSRDYAEQRLYSHLADAERLRDAAERYLTSGVLTEEDLRHLDECEKRDEIFGPELESYVSHIFPEGIATPSSTEI